uniref:Cyclin-C n=1 Tax=Steinernema glaseri TaxID=37863 RepID=A0A1I7YHZ2_9BILA
MQVVATACVYFRRFYAKRSFKDIDPFLLAPTCVILASKVEEQGMLSSTKIVNSVAVALKKWPFLNLDVQNFRPLVMQEAEFFLLEILDCCLVVYHPYRPLMQMWNDLASMYKDCRDLEELKSLSWRICNDVLKTDASLLYAPHLIAVACIAAAAVYANRDIKLWFAEINVDYEKVFEVQHMLMTMYGLWRSFKESEQLPAILEKMPKPAQTPSLNGSQQSGQHQMNMMPM